MSSQLIRSVILEYAMPLAAFLLLKLLAVGIAGSNRKDSSERRGIDGVGNALVVVIAMRILQIVVAVVFLVANPIRILVRYRQELAGFSPAFLCGAVLLIGIPLAASIPVIFEVPISNYLYNRKKGGRSLAKKTTGKTMYKYDPEKEKPMIRASICNGEQVAGFKDLETGAFHEVMLIRDDRDLAEFKQEYGLEHVDKEY